MRKFSILRTLVLAAALSAPLAQAAMAEAADIHAEAAQKQQAMVQTDNGSAGSFGSVTDDGPYNNDALLSPSVGG